MSYTIIEGTENIALDEVMPLLSQTYWASDRPREVVERSMKSSQCYGVRSETGKLVGFARVITDFATNLYLCDVIIDSAHRGCGLGKALVSYVLSADEYKGLKGLLMTKDAHWLYEKYGFKAAEKRVMIREVDY